MSFVVTQGEIGFRVRSRTGSINSTLKKKKTLRKIPTTNINNKCNVLLQCCSEFYIIWSKQNLQDYSVTSFASLVNSVIKLKIPGMKVQLREIHGRVKWG